MDSKLIRDALAVAYEYHRDRVIALADLCVEVADQDDDDDEADRAIQKLVELHGRFCEILYEAYLIADKQVPSPTPPPLPE